MRKLLVVLSALLMLILGASLVNAQIPNVQVYFTTEYGVYGKTTLSQCPDGDFGTIYVVASNFNMWMSAIEYKVEYPPEVIWLADNTGGINIGNSSIGIATGWSLPQNAFVPFAVNNVTVLYNCSGCACPRLDIPILVVPNPTAISGQVQAVRWPDNTVIAAIGMLSYICPEATTIPVEETSWGQIKALYND